MARKEINTSITIAASADQIWKVLSNFDDYAQWNPFITSAQGNFKVGETISIIAGGMQFKPELLVFDINKEIRWKGKFLIKGLFDGEHIFIINENDDGTCTFRHEEIFTGLLVSAFSKKLDAETKPGFEEMNRKLKEMVENTELQD